MKVYVAGPYTNGDVAVNVRNAIVTGERLLEMGHIPYIPHLMHFWHFLFPHPYEMWVKIDNAFLPYCDAVLRLPGRSDGTDIEAALAKSFGIPVVNSIGELENLS